MNNKLLENLKINLHQLLIIFKLSYRELKGSIKEFKIIIISIFLGVFIISGVGSVSENLKYEINNKSNILLGGDFELSATYQPFPVQIKNWLDNNGKTTHIIELRTMLSSKILKEQKQRLVELKAVDNYWPLIGSLSVIPKIPINKSMKKIDNIHGALIDESLKKQLKINVGDILNLGQTKIKIRGIIIKEPDRLFSFATFGSRLLVTTEALKDSEIVVPGSLVKYKVKFIPTNKNLKLTFLKNLVQDTNISIKTIKNSTNNFNKFIEKTSLFISFVGLISLLISGVGISNGVNGYLIKKIKNIAIFKTLGAKSSTVFQIYFLQIIFVFIISSIPAVLLGITIPFLLSSLISENLLTSFQPAIFINPIIMSLLFGMIVCLLFTIIPISRTYKIKPIQLIRMSSNHSLNNFSKKIKVLILILILSLCLLILKLTGDLKTFFYIFTVIFFSFIILISSTNLLFILLKKINFKVGSISELSRKSLIRPGSFSKSIVMSFSIGLSLLITLNIIEGSLDYKITNTINQEAPNYFLIDIQPNQIDKVKKITSDIIDLKSLNSQPMLRGRITEIKGIKVDKLTVNKDVQWVLKSDRAFSWSNKIPPNVNLISGKWWAQDYDGPILISIGEKIAKGLNLKIGDNIKFNVLGRSFEAKIFNTREILWQNMGINFVFILSKNDIERAPHTWIATLTNKNEKSINTIVERIVNNFANISYISVNESFKAIKSLLNLLITIINSIAFLTLFSGVIVLSGILSVSKKDKLYEVAIFKILGASPKKIIILWFQEYLIIGFMTSLISFIIGLSISYFLLRYIFDIDYHVNFLTLSLLSLIVPIIIITITFIQMFKLIYLKPLEIIRFNK